MKPLGSILKYFKEAGNDDKEIFHDIKRGYYATFHGSEIVVIGVGINGDTLTVHEVTSGERHIKFSELEHISVYKLDKVA